MYTALRALTKCVFAYYSLVLLLLLLLVSAAACQQPSDNKGHVGTARPQADTVFQSADLVLVQLSPHSYQHISFLQTNDFGHVPCNGMVVAVDGEALVFDTPATDSSAASLIQVIQQQLKCRLKAVVPTHFHGDCLNGMRGFEKAGVPVFASSRTGELASENNLYLPVSTQFFSDSMELSVAEESVRVQYFGEGHTADNVIAYYPAERVLFGGCLIKELDAGEGFLGDANTQHWPLTVAKVKQAFSDADIVIPGHGTAGDARLLDYTIKLFQQKTESIK